MLQQENKDLEAMLESFKPSVHLEDHDIDMTEYGGDEEEYDRILVDAALAMEESARTDVTMLG